MRLPATRFNVATETAGHAMLRYLAERGYLASVPGLGHDRRAIRPDGRLKET
jgi:hypothetical protein